MRVTSEMAANTSSGGAEMSREISSLVVIVKVHHKHPMDVEPKPNQRTFTLAETEEFGRVDVRRALGGRRKKSDYLVVLVACHLNL
jgi:hypothetical protein